MKKLLMSIAAITLGLAAITSAWADTYKIGLLNMQNLLQQLPQMKQVSDDLKKQFGDREAAITAAQASFKKDAEDFKRNMAVMSSKDKQDTEQKLIRSEQELQQNQTSFQRDYVAAQNKAITALLEKVKAAVNEVAQKDKYNLILVNSSVAYADKSFDVTQEVQQAMMAANK